MNNKIWIEILEESNKFLQDKIDELLLDNESDSKAIFENRISFLENDIINYKKEILDIRSSISWKIGNGLVQIINMPLHLFKKMINN